MKESRHPNSDFTTPHGAGVYVVEQGECLMSISAAAGFHWRTIWEAAENSGLKGARGSGKVLLPGDRLAIPEKRIRAESGGTEERHRFRRLGLPARLRLRLRADGEPLANQPFSAEIDGRAHTGTTDASGMIDIPIPNDAASGAVRVGAEGGEQHVYELRLGALDPQDSATGVQSRLIQLGYMDGPASDEWNDGARSALRRFQTSRGIDPSGAPDKQTLDALAQAHGS